MKQKKLKFIGFKCTSELYEKIQRQAEKEDRPAGGFLRRITQEWFKNKEKREQE